MTTSAGAAGVLRSLPRMAADDLVRMLDTTPVARVVVTAEGVGTFASKVDTASVSRHHTLSKGLADELTWLRDELGLPDIFDARRVTSTSTAATLPVPNHDAVTAPVFLHDIERITASSVEDARKAASARMLRQHEATGLLVAEDGSYHVGTVGFRDTFPSTEFENLGGPRSMHRIDPEKRQLLALGRRKVDYSRDRWAQTPEQTETMAPPAIERLDLRGETYVTDAWAEKGWTTSHPRLPDDMPASVDWQPGFGELDSVYGQNGMIEFPR